MSKENGDVKPDVQRDGATMEIGIKMQDGSEVREGLAFFLASRQACLDDTAHPGRKGLSQSKVITASSLLA